MTTPEDLARTYREIADAYDHRGVAPMRDRFLVLAADAAQTAGKAADAEKFRRRLLAASPHHLLKPYASFAQAVEAPDLLAYIQDLRKHYPANTARELLATLQKEDANGEGPSAAKKIEFPFDATTPVVKTKQPAIFQFRSESEDTAREPTAALPPTMPPGMKPSQPLSKRPAPRGLEAPAPRPRSADSSKPASRPNLKPLSASSPSLPRRVDPVDDEQDSPSGSWLSAALFGLVIIAGVLLAGYTVIKPLLR